MSKDIGSLGTGSLTSREPPEQPKSKPASETELMWSFTIEQDGMTVAAGEGMDRDAVEAEMWHYAKMYAQDGHALIALRSRKPKPAKRKAKESWVVTPEWRLAPVEPTEEMTRAAYAGQPNAISAGFAQAYRDMLAAVRPSTASPAPASTPQGVTEAGLHAAEQAIWERSEDRDGWPVLLYREDVEAAINAANGVAPASTPASPDLLAKLHQAEALLKQAVSRPNQDDWRIDVYSATRLVREAHAALTKAMEPPHE